MPLHDLRTDQTGHQAGGREGGTGMSIELTDKPADLAASRRGFLVTMVAGTALFGFATSAEAATAKPGAKTGAAAFEPTIWYSIAPDGVVTVNVIRAEMGQHVGTAIARIVADELEADWSKVKVHHVDSD